jgi:hypothetical protein
VVSIDRTKISFQVGYIQAKFVGTNPKTKEYETIKSQNSLTLSGLALVETYRYS